MAFVGLTPVSANLSAISGLAQKYQFSTINDLSGAAVNLSAWTSMTAQLVAVTPTPNTADVTFGTVVGASGGVLTLQIAAADLAAIPAGQARLIVSGKPTSGDDAQILVSGVLNLTAS